MKMFSNQKDQHKQDVNKRKRKKTLLIDETSITNQHRENRTFFKLFRAHDLKTEVRKWPISTNPIPHLTKQKWLAQPCENTRTKISRSECWGKSQLNEDSWNFECSFVDFKMKIEVILLIDWNASGTAQKRQHWWYPHFFPPRFLFFELHNHPSAAATNLKMKES